jgi:hypothetical protein
MTDHHSTSDTTQSKPTKPNKQAKGEGEAGQPAPYGLQLTSEDRFMALNQREFFSRVRKTVIPRPVVKVETHVPGQRGTVRAAAATIYGPNWYHDPVQDLIEVWDAGPALCFKDLLPRKDLYAREGLYLRLTLAYRTTQNACVNIRTFSGNHVTLFNAPHGAMFEDPFTRFWVTEDCTININSIYRDERVWLQRVDWEWVSRQTIYEDELPSQDPFLNRTREEVAAMYVEKPINEETVKQFLINRIQKDNAFAKRCLLLLCEDQWLGGDVVRLYEMLNRDSE